MIDEAKLTSDAQVSGGEETKTQNFEADVARLLQLMVHSVYSDRDIFVRELVSNAADACEKLRYEAIAKPELIASGEPFRIEIALDPERKTIAFFDNGVGMARAELVDALGTIARRADLVEPLICRGNVLGAITLTGLARNPDGQPVEDRDSLVMFGMSAAIALENARLHAQEVRRSEELEALLSALQVITSGERLQDVLNRLVGVTAKISKCPNVSVALLDQAQQAAVQGGSSVDQAIRGMQAIKGTLSLGQIVAFTNYLLATMNPLIMMTQLSNTWANGLASAKRINEVLDAESEVAESPDAAELPSGFSGSVSFDHVDFHYNGDSGTSVLEGICLEAESGRTIAILGATGSGKTSLVNLIPRFYDPSRGRVSIGGHDLRGLKEDSILARVAIVPQEAILFSGTVRDNIRYGRPDASEEEVVAAAKAAEAHDFILGLPRGYDSRIEERGVNVSGGQKQRIAIARAIIERPAILILDDSTSAVDVETETRIQAALGALMQGCTCFIVAQRISTVLNADKIIVLDEGRIVAEGKHAQLIKTSPIYREIYDSQLGGDFHAD